MPRSAFSPLTLDDFAPDRLRPLRRSEYDRMVAMGVFNEDERLELLRGLVVEMSPQKASHSAVVQRLTELFVLRLHGRASLRVQLPLAVSDDSEPEPDLAIVAIGEYDDEHPRTAYLVIEVADASLTKDRRVKGPLYAAASVPEYWIVDVAAAEVEVNTEPSATGYRTVNRHRAGESIRVVRFPDLIVTLSQIFAGQGVR